MPLTARPTPVDGAALDDCLPGWDGGDAFVVDGPCPVDASTAARALFDLTPRGRAVLRLRDLLVRPLGLEPALGAGDAFLPVLSRTPDRVVLGTDDRHLDLRVLVDVGPDGVRCTTGVRRRALGRAYFAVVGPFHRALVPRMLLGAARRGWTSRG